MKNNRKWLKILGIVILFIAAIGIILAPGNMKWVVLIVGYLCLVVDGLLLKKATKQVMNHIKMLDQEKKYIELIAYLDEVAPLGYTGFVVDSYRLYANYWLGDFAAYRVTAGRMAATRAWGRPKFQDYRKKVEMNLACMDLVDTYYQNGTISYQGNEFMIMEAVGYYQKEQPEKIQELLNQNPKLPKLKKFVLYMLLGNKEEQLRIYPKGYITQLLGEE